MSCFILIFIELKCSYTKTNIRTQPHVHWQFSKNWYRYKFFFFFLTLKIFSIFISMLYDDMTLVTGWCGGDLMVVFNWKCFIASPILVKTTWNSFIRGEGFLGGGWRFKGRVSRWAVLARGWWWMKSIVS